MKAFFLLSIFFASTLSQAAELGQIGIQQVDDSMANVEINGDAARALFFLAKYGKFNPVVSLSERREEVQGESYTCIYNPSLKTPNVFFCRMIADAGGKLWPSNDPDPMPGILVRN